MIGPVEGSAYPDAEMKRLAALSNVYVLGAKPVHDLPAYVQHLDVCMLCYKVDGYTRFIYPLKLHEYLAGGRPIVGPSLETLRCSPKSCGSPKG